MKRREFICYSTLGSSSFVVTLGLFNPSRSDAFPFLLRLLGGTLMDAAFGALMQGAFTLARRAWGRRTQEFYDRRFDAMLAQREFVARQFTNVNVAEVNNPQYSVILAAQTQENLGENLAFAFPQMRNSEPSIAYFAGPASIGMGIAARYLREHERMNPEQVQQAILPKYQNYSDWKSWHQPTKSYTVYENVASDHSVLICYEPVDLRPGGHGIIDVTVNAERRIVIPTIRVEYARA